MTTRSTAAEVDARIAGLTIPKQFLRLADNHPDASSLSAMDADGGWVRFSVGDVRKRAAQVAAGFLANDVTPDERVLLMMRNRPDFHWFDLGAQFVRATPVSIYNSSSPEEIQYLADHAEAEVAIVEDDSFLQRMLKVRDELPQLEKIFVIDPPEGPLPDGVFPAEDLFAHGEADLEALAAETSPDDLATLIYTSGTTGPPKGVMLNQYNIVFTVELLLECFDRTHAEALGWRVVSYLPMAHIAERATSHYGALVFGYDVACCPDPNELTTYLKEVHPQLLFGVPRVFEKIYENSSATGPIIHAINKNISISSMFSGSWVEIRVNGFFPVKYNIKKIKPVISPKITDQSSPFFNPSVTVDTSRPMEGNPFSNVIRPIVIINISIMRTVPIITIGLRGLSENRNIAAPSIKAIANKIINRVFILI